jgi:hypothetical protein
LIYSQKWLEIEKQNRLTQWEPTILKF